MSNYQTRAVELRYAPDQGDGNTFEGRACTYNVKDAYNTTFVPGCFTRGGLDVGTYALLWQHDPTKPVGTLTAEERADGLYIVGRWDDNNAGREARAAAQSGSAAELSVGFMWSGDPDGIIAEARLLEVSQVTSRFAAVPGSVLTAIRSALDAQVTDDAAPAVDAEPEADAVEDAQPNQETEPVELEADIDAGELEADAVAEAAGRTARAAAYIAYARTLL